MDSPLGNVDSRGRDRATVEADKLACWQAAELSAGAPHSRTRWAVGPIAVNAIMQGASGDKIAALDKRIEHDAEQCMVSRGYTLRPK